MLQKNLGRTSVKLKLFLQSLVDWRISWVEQMWAKWFLKVSAFSLALSLLQTLIPFDMDGKIGFSVDHISLQFPATH